jgi:hypothetical protein
MTAQVRPATVVVLTIAAACAVFGDVAAAQTFPGTAVPVVHQQFISANPFGLMFEWVNAEYERKATESVTWGVGASFFARNHDSVDYASGGSFVRYYPAGAALTGFYLGGRGGIYRVSDAHASDVFYGVGFELGYNWLLGSKRNVGISVGLGATRLFGGALAGASLTIPTVRLFNVGVAF